MGKEQIIALLKKDMRGEHQAIIQYLSHAYALGGGEIAAEIEAIAREEMRHLDWLADAIVELGGDPTMERDAPDLDPGAGDQILLKNVDLEQMAIDQYRAHMDAIEDEGIRRLLARIVHDEVVHKGQFEDLAREAREQLEAASEGAPAKEGGAPPRMADILNYGIRHEYTVILQYLYHSFVAEDKELAEELQNTAINEMQHMGWLAEAMLARGGDADMSHTELFLSRDPEKNLKADIAVEQEVTRDYTSQISELEDAALQELLTRIRDHEIYHDAVFKDLLQEVEEKEEAAEEQKETAPPPQGSDDAPPSIPSVGSLIAKD